MNFISDLMNKRFDFIIPLYYIIIGIIVAIIIFSLRFFIYTKRKRYYTKIQSSNKDSEGNMTNNVDHTPKV